MTGPQPPKLPEDGPTQLVEGRDGELVERLSGGTATLLLVWLMGVGAGTALLGAWLLAALFLDMRLTSQDLFGAPGLYTALYGSTGPTVLWLAGRAQGHGMGWFIWTSAKIGVVMAAILVGGALMVLTAVGATPGSGFGVAALALAGFTLVASVLWGLATWAADRYIARARVEG